MAAVQCAADKLDSNEGTFVAGKAIFGKIISQFASGRQQTCEKSVAVCQQLLPAGREPKWARRAESRRDKEEEERAVKSRESPGRGPDLFCSFLRRKRTADQLVLPADGRRSVRSNSLAFGFWLSQILPAGD